MIIEVKVFIFKTDKYLTTLEVDLSKVLGFHKIGCDIRVENPLGLNALSVHLLVTPIQVVVIENKLGFIKSVFIDFILSGF